MTALNNELQISQGTVIDLKSSIGDVSLKIEQTTNYSNISFTASLSKSSSNGKTLWLTRQATRGTSLILYVVWV